MNLGKTEYYSQLRKENAGRLALKNESFTAVNDKVEKIWFINGAIVSLDPENGTTPSISRLYTGDKTGPVRFSIAQMSKIENAEGKALITIEGESVNLPDSFKVVSSKDDETGTYSPRHYSQYATEQNKEAQAKIAKAEYRMDWAAIYASPLTPASQKLAEAKAIHKSQIYICA